MDYPKNVWNQLKAKTGEDFIKALERDGWVFEGAKGAIHAYRHPDGRRVTIHRHPTKGGYGPSLLKALLADIGWSVEDLKRLKLIKKA